MDIFNGIDPTTLGYIAVMSIGAVNVVIIVLKKYFKTDLDADSKWMLSVALAFLISFIPAEVGSMIADRLIQAFQIGLLGSGVYKIAQKTG